jgi:malate/lactate dehydrogenase
LLSRIARGDVFGERRIILHLCDLEVAMERLNGTVMELYDSAYPTLAGVMQTTDLNAACKDIDAAFLVASVPHKSGMVRSDLLAANASLMHEQGAAIGKHAKSSVRVLVIGNPCNTNAMVAALAAPQLEATNFQSLSFLDTLRSSSLLSEKVGTSVGNVKDAFVWGLSRASAVWPMALC